MASVCSSCFRRAFQLLDIAERRPRYCKKFATVESTNMVIKVLAAIAAIPDLSS